MELFTYFRSSASWRVRIAMNLKGLSPQQQFIHLTKNGGMQNAGDFAALNPEHLVPVLRDGDETLTQSLAILEYLEERHPEPALLPAAAGDRAWVRALSLQIACDIHPLNNLRVLQYIERTLGLPADAKQAWITHWVTAGFTALEAHLSRSARTGLCCFGDTPTMADCCLAPQVFNARRFQVNLDAYPTIVRIDAHLAQLDAFRAAVPASQPDAE
ncbi:MAG: maleylacetoacetate isomerase [Polaromonas sp.]|nr:maleylacetoacetate isomerase [Polaromonas sp.]